MCSPPMPPRRRSKEEASLVDQQSIEILWIDLLGQLEGSLELVDLQLLEACSVASLHKIAHLLHLELQFRTTRGSLNPRAPITFSLDLILAGVEGWVPKARVPLALACLGVHALQAPQKDPSTSPNVKARLHHPLLASLESL
jgi:hypothetical protein